MQYNAQSIIDYDNPMYQCASKGTKITLSGLSLCIVPVMGRSGVGKNYIIDAVKKMYIGNKNRYVIAYHDSSEYAKQVLKYITGKELSTRGTNDDTTVRNALAKIIEVLDLFDMRIKAIHDKSKNILTDFTNRFELGYSMDAGTFNFILFVNIRDFKSVSELIMERSEMECLLRPSDIEFKYKVIPLFVKRDSTDFNSTPVDSIQYERDTMKSLNENAPEFIVFNNIENEVLFNQELQKLMDRINCYTWWRDMPNNVTYI